MGQKTVHRKMSVRQRSALFALLALTAVAGPLAVAGSPAPVGLGQAHAAQTSPVPPRGTTAIEIQLDQNSDAKWTITTQLRVDSDEREAFRELIRQYEQNDRMPPWLEKVRAASTVAEKATGRNMTITHVRKSSTVDNRTLSLSFTWTNFARTDGDQVVIDDTFNTSRGTWLDGLTENQHLTIELPRGYGVVSAPKGAIVQNARVSWEGPEAFEPGYMHIVYNGDADPVNTAGPGQNDGIPWGGFFVLGLGIVAVGAYVFSQRRHGPFGSTADAEDESDGLSRTNSALDPSTDEETRGATTGTVEPDTGEPSDGVDEELLSDEERVERLLESNGGRMKQANIVTETGWSNAKVSQLLSSMADEESIDKLRIGRENLISFPDEDVTDVDGDSS